MKIISNEKLIKRNALIAQITVPAGMVIVLGGIYLFTRNPNNVVTIWGVVLAGFAISQIGIYFSNRWGRRPRPDEQLNQALKGLDQNYSIYHYTTPTAHLLVGPAGIWALLPHYQRGTIVYEKDRWRQKGGGFLLAYLKIFGQESLGRPDLEIKAELETIDSFLKKKLPGFELPPSQAALIFTDERAVLQADEAPVPTIYLKKLKEVIRKAGKAKVLPVDKAKEIQEILEGKAAAESSVITEQPASEE